MKDQPTPDEKLKCPECGETENFHYNYDYTNKEAPPYGVLCNECGSFFNMDGTLQSKVVGEYEEPKELPDPEKKHKIIIKSSSWSNGKQSEVKTQEYELNDKQYEKFKAFWMGIKVAKRERMRILQEELESKKEDYLRKLKSQSEQAESV